MGAYTIFVMTRFSYRRFCVMPPEPPELVALSDLRRMPNCVPLNVQFATTRFETPRAVLLPMESPWPNPKAQLVTIVYQDVPPVLPRAMQSSPSLIEQSLTRTLVPSRSMPSVLGEL